MSMRCFVGRVTTTYYAMEWGQDFIVYARDLTSAIKKAEKANWTHGDTIEEGEEEIGETQEVGALQCISKADCLVLLQHLPLVEIT